MKSSVYKSYDELPLFSASTWAPAEAQRSGFGGKRRRSGMSEFSPPGGNEGYGACADEMHEKDFPTLRIGSRMVVPKEKFIQWVEEHTKGGERA